ncbi:MAG: transporter [Sphingomicrobium sp.]
MTKLFFLTATALIAPTAALAQATPASPAPAPAGPPALCTDRPTKASSACTVPKGMVQFETDGVNWSKLNIDGVRTDTILYTNPTMKYGLTDSTDIEASIAPYETIRTRDIIGVSKVGGVGDLYLRVKQRLSSSDAKAQFALIPYLKIPTAKTGLGNRKVEGGLVGTGAFTLPNDYSLTVTPEIDYLENANVNGHHVQIVGAFNVGKTLSPKLTAYAELWTARDYDPAGHVRQYSADFAVAYLASPLLQLDAGTNLGLNRATPGIQVYVGVST